MGIDLQIAFGVNGQIDEAMSSDLIKHVLEKGKTRLHLTLAAPVQVDGNFDLRF
jgi:hypothetical protein